MKPQAMNAAMFGMTMPDKNVPNFCTATRAPPILLVLVVPTSAFAAMFRLRVEGRAVNTPHDVLTGPMLRSWYDLHTLPV
jgi:hypothetical protein